MDLANVEINSQLHLSRKIVLIFLNYNNDLIKFEMFHCVETSNFFLFLIFSNKYAHNTS